MSIQPVVVYGTSWCADCRRAVRVLNEMQVPYRYINIEEDEQAAQYVVKVNHGNRSVPTIVFPDGSMLIEPSNSVLRDKLQG